MKMYIHDLLSRIHGEKGGKQLLAGQTCRRTGTRRAFHVRFLRGAGPPPSVQYINEQHPMGRRERGGGGIIITWVTHSTAMSRSCYSGGNPSGVSEPPLSMRQKLAHAQWILFRDVIDIHCAAA